MSVNYAKKTEMVRGLVNTLAELNTDDSGGMRDDGIAFVVTIMINLLEIVEHQEQEIERLTDESLHHIH